MMSCRVVRRHIDAHVDGELDTRSQVELDDHLAHCPHCRDEAAATSSLKQATRDAVRSVRAPAQLRVNLLAALAEADAVAAAQRPPSVPPTDAAVALVPTALPAPDRPAHSDRQGYAVALRYARFVVPAAAAVVVFAAFATRTTSGPVTSPSGALPIFEDVVRRHAAGHPAEVRGTEPEVSRWLHDRFEFQARPVAFEPSSHAHLVGARISNVREQEAAALYYDVDGHRVTVIVFEPPPSAAFSDQERVRFGGQELYFRQVRGYAVPMVQRDGLTYAFTGDLDSQSMIQLAATAQTLH